MAAMERWPQIERVTGFVQGLTGEQGCCRQCGGVPSPRAGLLIAGILEQAAAANFRAAIS